MIPRCWQQILFSAIVIGPASWTLAKVPEFNANRAFSHLVRQCDFGPRNPGSSGHQACLEYLVETLSKCTESVQLQTFQQELPGGDHKIVSLNNIFARFGKQSHRILLCAHWDTRPWADEDPDPDNRDVPILGANDGASGVSVLLELAQILSEHPASIGVDMVLFDAEDAGLGGQWETWCLGSAYFAKSGILKQYPEYAVLLDLVGDADLHFPIEYYSNLYAPLFVKKIWGRAWDLGLDAFTESEGPAVIDDHLNLLKAGIPAVNIIDFDYSYWHTIEDTPDKCSPTSLKTVGVLLVSLIYEE